MLHHDGEGEPTELFTRRPSSEAHDRSYMLSTQLQVLMWGTMNCKVEQKELEVVAVPGENCLIIGHLENLELKFEESVLPSP